MDILNILHGHYNEVCGGTYYERMPQTPEDAGIPFDYEPVNPAEWHYQQLFANVNITEKATASIKTCDPLKWHTGAYIAAQDGRMYTILSVQEDNGGVSKEAHRLLPIPVGVDYVMRLSEVDNPWGLA